MKSVKKYIVVFLVVATLLSLTACKKSGDGENGGISSIINSAFSDNIDLSSCFNVTYEGSNGYGKAIVNTNPNFETVVDGAKIRAAFPALTEQIPLNTLFIFSLADDTMHNLKNGDAVTINASINSVFETFGITLDTLQIQVGMTFTQQYSVTVSGLQEAITLDFFAAVEPYMEYKGANGYGRLVFGGNAPDSFSYETNGFYVVDVGGTGNEDSYIVSVTRDNKQLFNAYFSTDSAYDDSQKLSYGDKAVVSFEVNNEEALAALEQQGYYVLREKTYDVPDLGTFANALSDLSAAQLETIKLAGVNNVYYNGVDDGFAPHEYICMYSGIMKPAAITLNDGKLQLIVVYKSSNGYYTGYFATIFNDIVIAPDGTLKYEIKSGVINNIYDEADATAIIEEYIQVAQSAYTGYGNTKYDYTKIG